MTGEERDLASQGSPFWRFSLSFYGSAEIRAACLAMQDVAGADVNIVLYLLFSATRGRVLSQQAVVDLDAGVADWRAHIVRPLRTVRRTAKDRHFWLLRMRRPFTSGLNRSSSKANVCNKRRCINAART